MDGEKWEGVTEGEREGEIFQYVCAHISRSFNLLSVWADGRVYLCCVSAGEAHLGTSEVFMNF